MMCFFISVLLAGVFYCPTTRCAPAGNNTGNHYNHYGNHYSNYYYDHHEANKHQGHHDYEGGDDLFGHVKTNLTHHPDHHIYNDLYNYGMSHYEHVENDTDTGGNGLIDNIKKIFKSDAETVSSSSTVSLVSFALVATFVHKP